MTGPVSAALIVDTGPGPTITSGFGGLTIGSNQWLAAEFSLGGTTTITGVQGWIGIGIPNGNISTGTGTAVIYTDGGDVPGSELFSAAFATADSASSWDGASGLSWLLNAGTYWVAFEVRSGQTLSDGMPRPSSSPLGNEAFNNSGAYVGFDSLDIGVRIFGEQPQPPPPQIPEPASLALLGIGLAGLGATRRRKIA